MFHVYFTYIHCNHLGHVFGSHLAFVISLRFVGCSTVRGFASLVQSHMQSHNLFRLPKTEREAVSSCCKRTAYMHQMSHCPSLKRKRLVNCLSSPAVTPKNMASRAAIYILWWLYPLTDRPTVQPVCCCFLACCPSLNRLAAAASLPASFSRQLGVCTLQIVVGFVGRREGLTERREA